MIFIRNLVKAIKTLLLLGEPEKPIVYPEKFDDSVALMCSWHCLKTGSANFVTHKLTKTPEKSLIYQSTIFLKIFGIPFIIIGVAMLIAYFATIILYWFMPIIGVVLMAAGIVILFQSIIPIGLDSEKKLFYKGFRKNKFTDVFNERHCTPFNQIHAVQLLTKIGKVSSSSDGDDHYFYAYELNLVLHDGSRKYVMTYINAEQVQEDAREISKLINIPVWNSIGDKR